SFLLASMLRKHVAGDAFFRNALLMPYLMPSSAMLVIWLLIFDYGGVINRLLVGVGLERVFWLEGSALRVPIVLLYIWKILGFSVVIFTAALQAVPEALYEYASLEGAGYLRREFSITLPQILPTAFLVLVLAIVNAFKIFKEVYFIGGAYPDESIYTLQHYMNNKFAKLDYQDVTTAAYSFAVIVIALFLLMYTTKSVRQGETA
ncbi:MAG: sugar ABC transporter permease, partial [Clostridia bacterium]